MNLSASVVFIYFTHRRNKLYQTSHLDSLHENMKSGFGFPSLFTTFAPSFDQELLGGSHIYLIIMRAKGGWKNPNQFHFFFLSSIGARRKGDGQKKIDKSTRECWSLKMGR